MIGLEWRLRASLAGALAAAGRADDAAASLELARNLVSEQGNRIVDASMRRSFLDMAHAELAELEGVGTEPGLGKPASP